MKHAFDKADPQYRLRFDTEAFCKTFFEMGGTLDLWQEIGQRTAAKTGSDQLYDASQGHRDAVASKTPSAGPEIRVHKDHPTDAGARQ